MCTLGADLVCVGRFPDGFAESAFCVEMSDRNKSTGKFVELTSDNALVPFVSRRLSVLATNVALSVAADCPSVEWQTQNRHAACTFASGA